MRLRLLWPWNIEDIGQKLRLRIAGASPANRVSNFCPARSLISRLMRHDPGTSLPPPATLTGAAKMDSNLYEHGRKNPRARRGEKASAARRCRHHQRRLDGHARPQRKLRDESLRKRNASW